MAKLTFEDIRIREEKDVLKCILMNIFEFTIPIEEVKRIGDYNILAGTESGIEFIDISEKKATNKFMNLIGKYIEDLKSLVSGKQAYYIHQNSGIPLFGYSSIGVIDRGSNIIEVRPITGCNLNCIYCSVDEGKDSRKEIDFVVEEAYLIQEFNELTKIKEEDVELEAHIGTQGEPMLYAPIARLIADLRKNPKVNTISIDTNGMLLSKDRVDELVEAGLTRINLSLNSLDVPLGQKIANAPHNAQHLKELCGHIIKKCDLIIAPILLQGINDEQMEKIIEFAKELMEESKKNRYGHSIVLGLQNFLKYPKGRNPVKELPWEKFYELLREYENKHDVKLIVSSDDFKIVKTTTLPKPFKKGDVVKAEALLPGRYKNQMIAVAKGRAICVHSCNRKGQIKIRITRDKHNLFDATLA